MATKNLLPLAIGMALKRLGQDLRDARKRRRIPMELAAARASISRMTLSKVEKGDAGVSLGAYAKVLFVLGLLDRLNEIADPKFDQLGLVLESENLPKRIRIPRKEKEA